MPAGAARPGGGGLVSTALLVVGATGVVAMIYFIHHFVEAYWSGHWSLYVWHTITAGFIACVILAIVIPGTLSRAAFGNRIAVFLGTVSYSIYLWHFPITAWIARHIDVPSLGLGTALAVIVPPVIAASALSYYAVERPFLLRSR